MKRLALLAAVALTACQTPLQRLAASGEECRAMGYVPNTDPMRACIMAVEDRKAAARMQSAAILGAAGAAILTAPPPQPTQTNCRWFAGRWVCN